MLRIATTIVVAVLMAAWLTSAALAKQPGQPGGGGGGGGGTVSDTLAELQCTTDQIAKFDGNAWVCAEDKAVLTVIDATGTFIGMAQEPNKFSAEAFIVVPTLSPLIFASSVNPTGFQRNGFLFFTGPNCTGLPYFQASVAIWESFTRASAIVCPVLDANGSCLGTADLWVPADNSSGAIVNVSVVSRRNGFTGECEPVGPANINGSLAAFVLDLYSEFQIPFELVFPRQ